MEQAIKLADDSQIMADIIYIAGEIEAYVVKGTNVRKDFWSDVDAALLEVEHSGVLSVGAPSLERVMAKVRHELAGYNALYECDSKCPVCASEKAALKEANSKL